LGDRDHTDVHELGCHCSRDVEARCDPIPGVGLQHAGTDNDVPVGDERVRVGTLRSVLGLERVDVVLRLVQVLLTSAAFAFNEAASEASMCGIASLSFWAQPVMLPATV
jgi:hypothetical protein